MKDEEKKTRKKRKKKNHRVSNLVLVLILLTGAAIMAYPSFSEYWNSLHQSRAIMGYAQRVAELTNEEYETIWSAALDYNERLLKLPNRWLVDHDENLKADYETQLNADGTVSEKKYIDITAVTDERICDGFYYASAFKLMRGYLKNPSVLDEPVQGPVRDVD